VSTWAGEQRMFRAKERTQSVLNALFLLLPPVKK
jgi:hypothetical protein